MRRVLPVLAALGLVIGIAAVIFGNEPPKAPSVVGAVPKVPFGAWVAGAGALEASTQNIAVGTAVSGIVSQVHVSWGDRVRAGDRLFSLDDRDLEARLGSALAAVKVAEATLAKADHLLAFSKDLGESISQKDLATRRDDVAIDRAGLALAQAQVAEIRTEIERRTIRAPVDGSVFQVNVRAGEFAPCGPPLVVLGEDRTLHVRVEVDQHDSWRVQPGAKAVAFVRGNPSIQIPLGFVRIEPYVLPKLMLTGRTTERTDVKVLQVIYGFEHAQWPVYAGQEVDVFIEAAPLGDS